MGCCVSFIFNCIYVIYMALEPASDEHGAVSDLFFDDTYLELERITSLDEINEEWPKGAYRCEVQRLLSPIYKISGCLETIRFRPIICSASKSPDVF